MAKNYILFLFLLVLSGCATTAKYEAKLNSWIGKSEEALIASWGVPDKEYQMSNNKKAVAYVRKDTFQTGGNTYQEPQISYQSGTIGDKPFAGTTTTYVTQTLPLKNLKLSCKTSFIIDASGKIESWHHEGNNCASN